MNEKKHEPKGCGAPAERVAFRGRTKRTFFCGNCKYEGGGLLKTYATDVAGKEKIEGVFYGPARTCGQTVDE